MGKGGVLTGQLGQVHCPFGQLQVPEDEQPQSLMVKVGLSFFLFFFRWSLLIVSEP